MYWSVEACLIAAPSVLFLSSPVLLSPSLTQSSHQTEGCYQNQNHRYSSYWLCRLLVCRLLSYGALSVAFWVSSCHWHWYFALSPSLWCQPAQAHSLIRQVVLVFYDCLLVVSWCDWSIINNWSSVLSITLTITSELSDSSPSGSWMFSVCSSTAVAVLCEETVSLSFHSSN